MGLNLLEKTEHVGILEDGAVRPLPYGDMQALIESAATVEILAAQAREALDHLEEAAAQIAGLEGERAQLTRERDSLTRQAEAHRLLAQKKLSGFPASLVSALAGAHVEQFSA